MSSKAFSCFVKVDPDIDFAVNLICNRIHSEIDELGLVILSV